MKSKVLVLSKVILKNSFQNMETAKDVNSNKKSKSMIILYIFIFLYLAGIVGVFSNSLVSELLKIHQEKMFLGIILLAIAGFVLIQSIFSAINLLYYSKDNEYILPLPLKPSQIVIAKTNVLLVTEYFIVAIIGLIPLTIYGILTYANILYYIEMLIVLLVFPIVPVLISSLLVLIVMSFAKFTKNRNRFQLIATILILVIVFVASFAMGNTDSSPEELVQMVMKANGMVELVKNAFPTLGMAIESLTNINIGIQLLNIMLLIATTAIIYALYVLVGQKLYLKGAVGNLSSGKKNKKKIDEKKAFKNSTIFKTYVGKEFKILLRNPIFFMQCVLPAIIFPILIIGMTILGINEENNGQTIDFASMFINKTSIYIGVGILCVIQFFLMFIYISATAISRDGQNAIFMKYIPVKYIKQIDYKVMPNIIMTSIMSIITVIIAEILIKVDILYLLLILITSIIMGVFQSYILIIVDLKKPKLEWNSEYAVVKQNMNLIWPAVIGLVSITLLIILGIVFGNILNSFIFTGIIAFVYLLVTIITRNYINNNINKLMEKIY